MKSTPSDTLQSLPGVGPSIARDLADLGYEKPQDLHGADPERMYEQLCTIRQQRIDRCVLYVFRCAVYAAQTTRPKPHLLKWWNWKDTAQRRRSRG